MTFNCLRDCHADDDIVAHGAQSAGSFAHCITMRIATKTMPNGADLLDSPFELLEYSFRVKVQQYY